jgi:hypothetical protein
MDTVTSGLAAAASFKRCSRLAPVLGCVDCARATAVVAQAGRPQFGKKRDQPVDRSDQAEQRRNADYNFHTVELQILDDKDNATSAAKKQDTMIWAKPK